MSTGGSWVQFVAAGWLVFDLTHNVAALGVLALISRGPSVVFALRGGVLADRLRPRTLAVVLNAVQAVGAGTLAALAWLDAASVPAIYALTGLMAVAAALVWPAQQVTIADAVPRSLRARAVELNAVAYNVARVGGPLVAAVVLGLLGAAACFAVNAASFVAVVVAFAALPGGARPTADREHGSARSALRYARRDPAVRALLGGLAVFSFLAAPIQELAAAIAHDGGGGPHGVGLLVAALAAGTLAGIPLRTLLARSGVRPATVLPVVTALFAGGLVLVVVAETFVLVLVATVICGGCWFVAYTIAMTGSQLLAPAELQGRVLGLLQLVTAAGLSLGPLAVGALARLIGLDDALLAAAAALVALAAVGLVRPAVAIDRGFARAAEDAREPAGL